MKNLTEKQRLLFDGVIKIMKTGSDIKSTTVAEIASAAGVGKGTVYEYFESKEQLIFGAIIYMFTRELTEYEQAIESGDTFENKIDMVLKRIQYNFEDKSSVLHLLFQTVRSKDMEEYLNEEERYKCIEDYIFNILDKLIQSGIDEGIINSADDRKYQRMVVVSSVVMFVNSICSKSSIGNSSYETAKSNMLKLLTRALA